ncbi:MAG TPA: hypothetical protein ENN19_03990 [Chloroflexi bacterium]|nr:hypothetical protein [Chloroflexota bacterium]
MSEVKLELTESQVIALVKQLSEQTKQTIFQMLLSTGDLDVDLDPEMFDEDIEMFDMMDDWEDERIWFFGISHGRSERLATNCTN